MDDPTSGGSRVSVRLLGSVDVTCDGRSVVPEGVKRRSLLAMLALETGRVVSVDHLVDGIWGERAPASSRNLVQTYAMYWRRFLDQHLGAGAGAARLVLEGRGYTLLLDQEEVDVLEFRHLAAIGRVALGRGDMSAAAAGLQRAAALWRGEPMSDLVDQPFWADHGPALLQERRGVLLDLGAALTATGRPAEAAELVRSLVELSRLDEPAVDVLARALAADGRSAQALTLIDGTRRALADELGASLGPGLVDLHVRLLRQEGAVVTPGRTLPMSPGDSFVGRDLDLRALTDLVAANRLVTITGPGGCGKTRLALELARTLPDSGGAEVRFVDASALRHPGQLTTRAGEALDVRARDTQDMTSALRAALGRRVVTLLLDNLEQLTTAGNEVASLLAALPGLRVIATSRQSLGTRSEQRFPLSPLAVDAVDVGADDAGVPSPATQLFLDRVAAADPRLVTATTRRTAADVGRRLDGLPLAIELAAAWFPVLGAAGLVAGLDDLDTLRTSSGDRSDRHRTLRSTIDWSYDLLDPEARRLFCVLGAFRRSASVSALAAVSERDERAVLDTVRELVDRSLISVVHTPRGARVRMLVVIEQYAHERLELAGGGDRSLARHADHFLGIAASAVASGFSPASLEELDEEHDNVVAAIRWTHGAGRVRDALLAAGGLWRFWHLRAQLREGQALLRDLLQPPAGTAAGDGDDGDADAVARSAGLEALGNLYYWQLLHDSAAACYVEALELSRTVGDEAGAARAAYDLAYVEVARGRVDEAREMYAGCAAVFGRLGLTGARASAISGLALTDFFSGKVDDAVRECEEALHEQRVAGDRYGETNTLSLLGAVLRSAGRGVEAVPLLLAALAAQQQLWDVSGIAWLILELSACALQEGDDERALVLAGAGHGLLTDEDPRVPLHLLGLPNVRDAVATEPERSAQLWSRGAAMDVTEAVTTALRGRAAGLASPRDSDPAAHP